MAFPLLLIAFCSTCATYVVKKVHDIFHKKEKNKKKKLELKGKTIDQAREDNKVAQKEEKKSQQELEELDKKIKELENELEQTRNKINDPNLTDEERSKAFSLIWGQVMNDKGEKGTATIRCNDGYTLTVQASLLISQKILQGIFKAGYQTPASAYGEDLVLEIPGVERKITP